MSACYSASDDDDGGSAASDGGAAGSKAQGSGGDDGSVGGEASGATSGGGADASSGGSSGGSSSGGSSAGGSSGSSSGGTSGAPSGAIPCLGDEACSVEGLYCDEGRRVCVECTNHAECPTGTACAREQVCEPFTACPDTVECSGDEPVCIEDGFLGNWCVGCSASTDCPDGESCWHQSCTPDCDEDADCESRGQICNLTGGFCADCYIDTGCGENEFCNGLTCQPKDCTPGDVRCLGGDTVTCNPLGSGYGGPVSCGEYGCKLVGGQGVCDLPPTAPPDDALNPDGNFEDGGGDWHLNDLAIPLSNGMVCASDSAFMELGWPVDVANAALLTYQQTYAIRFRTSLSLTETWGTLSLDVKIGGPAEPYVEYFSQTDVPVSEGIQDHEFSFTMEEPTGSAGIVLMFLPIESEFCVDEIWLVPAG